MTKAAIKKVLIIDDDPRNIFALKAVLKSKGFEVVTAGGAAEGLQLLSDHGNIGILLLDMMMPEMDGYEAINLLRQSEHKDLPIISVTAQAMAGDRQKCLDAGANDYISKPIDVDELLRLLKQHIAAE